MVALSVVLLATGVAGLVLDAREESPTTEPPEQTAKYGYGRIFVEVPAHWGVDEFDTCGTPVRSSVQFSNELGALCASFLPAGVTAVRVDRGTAQRPSELEPVLVDGVEAGRRPTRCYTEEFTADDRVVCTGELVFVEDGIAFRVESTEGTEAVDRALDGVGVDEDLVGIPAAGGERDGPSSISGAGYVESLRRAGLDTVVVTQPWRRGVGAGDYVRSVPRPGMVVARGSTVTVTLGAAPAGSAGEVLLEMRAKEGEQVQQTFFDRDLRGHRPSTQVRLGTTFVPTFTGPRAGDVRIEIDRSAVAYDEFGGRRLLTAVRPGRSVLHFVLTDGDREYHLASLVVVVQKELPYRVP